jgi:serine protease
MDSAGFVNNSSCAHTYQSAINIALANNSILVTAAGNHNIDAAIIAPGNCNGVITVAAVDRAGRKSSYSNFGSVVDVAAPGGEAPGSWPSTGLLSTYNNGTFSWGGDNYQGYSGTSISSALVSGVVALMVSRNPSLTSAQVLQILRANARPLTSPCTPACNFGIVDAAASVRAAAALTE